MKPLKSMRVAILMATCAMFLACGQQLPSTPQLNTQLDSVSYLIGNNIAYQSVGVDLNAEMIYRGFKDVKDSIDPAISEEEARTVMAAFQQQLQQEQMKKMQQEAVENEIIGQKFLEDNLAKEGVEELPSGLQYKVLASGSGESPTLTSRVRAKYTGRLIDGTQFDSSDDDPRGFREFGVNEVIPGWTEALQLMKPGDSWEIYIPGNLAYGQAGRGPSIPPNATLIFELELLEVLAGQ